MASFNLKERWLFARIVNASLSTLCQSCKWRDGVTTLGKCRLLYCVGYIGVCTALNGMPFEMLWSKTGCRLFSALWLGIGSFVYWDWANFCISIGKFVVLLELYASGLAALSVRWRDEDWWVSCGRVLITEFWNVISSFGHCLKQSTKNHRFGLKGLWWPLNNSWLDIPSV